MEIRETPKRVVIEKNKKVYYILPNGKKSKVFDGGRDFAEGYAAVRKGKKWFFMDENGKLSKDWYAHASEHCCGYSLVEDREGKKRYRDLDGNLSEAFDWAYEFMNGYGVVIQEGKQYFFDGARSIQGYAQISCINEEYAAVKMFLEDGSAEKEWRYINLKNMKVSDDKYAQANHVVNGFSKVVICPNDPQPMRMRRAEDGMLSQDSFDFVSNFKADEEFTCVNVDGTPYYLDKDLKLWKDEKYYSAGEYENGFAQVRFNENIARYRDMLGRHSDNKTKSGEDFYKYYNGGISINKLSALHFIDKRFCDGILRIERRKIEQKARIIHNSQLDNKTKKAKYNALVEEMNAIKKIVSEKQSKGILMEKNAREAEARRRAEEKKKRDEAREDSAAFNELLDSLK